MFRRGAAEAAAGLLLAGLLFAVLVLTVSQRNRLAATPASRPQVTARGLVATAQPTPVPTPSMVPATPPPTRAPTAPPTRLATAAPAVQCSAADLFAHTGAAHTPGYQGNLNSVDAHPGDRMLLSGYVAFSRAAHGCVLPPSTARLFVLDPSAQPVSWWPGMSVRWPRLIGWPPGGCGCTAPAPVAASVLWMCTTPGSCAGAPLGDYTLVVTVTLDDGTVVARGALTMPTSGAPPPSPT